VTFYRPEELQERAVRRLARLPGGLRGLRALVRAWPGPSPDDRADTVLFVWGRVSNARDESVCHVLTTPNGYAFTADALVRVVDRLGSQTIPPGAHSPLSALGAEFVLECDGVHLDPEPFELRE
jgi:saccharopine dehydrogenase (NAD+, L-lysine-forming)